MSGGPDGERASRSYAGGVTNGNAGPVGGHVIQAGNIHTVNVTAPVTDAVEPPPRPAGTSWTPRKVLLAVAGALLILAVLPFLPQGPDAIPPESGTRPAGSSDEAVVAAVRAALVSCAQSRVIRQANCPQRVDDLVGDADDVHWALHGDPLDGAYPPVWNDDRFVVAGFAVMTVTYRVSYQLPSPQSLEVEVVPFRAEITWSDGKAAVTDLRQVETIDKQRIRKRDPKPAPDQVSSAVGKAFRKCVTATRSPMPPECPSSPAVTQSDQATWKLDGDPLQNSKQDFEPSTGMIHVRGSYAATLTTHDQVLGMNLGTTTPQSGDYDATVILDGTDLKVLQIKNA